MPLKPTESVKVERLADDQVLVKIIDSDKGKKVKDVFARLDEARGGYRPPKRKAEAASILRMLKNHTPDQIIETWHTIKAEPFWDKKELFMMTVESHIGALIHGTHQHSSRAIGGDQSKYIGGKYGKLVQS